ncbi:MFS general substrate transporter [Mycena floridula]|nr:MFS general substrate transporter [Mycena floridula]
MMSTPSTVSEKEDSGVSQNQAAVSEKGEPAVSKKAEASAEPENADPPVEEVEPQRDIRFWLVFLALCCTILLSALDLGGIGTAAPTIVSDLDGEDFSWVVSASSLASASSIPLSGNLGQIFGRRPIALGAVVLFGIGSAVAGSAKSMNILVVGRAIQGAGDGAIQASVATIISDIVPLRQRGLFQGFTGIIWSLGSLVGPFIAGSLAERASWRWLFYMNIPLCGLVFSVVFLFLNLHVPQENLRQKLASVDWLGNSLITASTVSMMLGLTWGGTRYAWGSARIIVLLTLGAAGMGASIFYESRWPVKPTIPLVVLANRTTLAGYFATFMQLMVTTSVGFYLASWFQSVRQATAITSAIYTLPLGATIAPGAIMQGIIVSKTGRYRVLTGAALATALIGYGLLISMKRSTPIGAIVVYQLILGSGLGLSFATTFVVLAPLPLAHNAAAAAFMQFLRALGQAWGITVGGVVLQNELPARLPSEALVEAPNGSLAYTIIPLIADLPDPVRTQVKIAFFESLRLVWIALGTLCGAALLSVLFMKDVPLRRTVDKKWGTQPSKGAKTFSPESPASATPISPSAEVAPV